MRKAQFQKNIFWSSKEMKATLRGEGGGKLIALHKSWEFILVDNVAKKLLDQDPVFLMSSISPTKKTPRLKL